LVLFESLVRDARSISPQTHGGDASLTGSKPPGRHRRVRKEDEHGDAQDESDRSSDDEERSPLMDYVMVDE
jgi:hypothetical protein